MLLLDCGHNIFQNIQIARKSDAGYAVFTSYLYPLNEVLADLYFPHSNRRHSPSWASLS